MNILSMGKSSISLQKAFRNANDTLTRTRITFSNLNLPSIFSRNELNRHGALL